MAQSFNPSGTIVPQQIGGMEVLLFTPGAGSNKQSSATVRVEIVYSDGSSKVQTYNLVEHLSGDVINALVQFMGDVRAKAVTEILPRPQ